MKQVFLSVLNMSVTASYVILFVLAARILLRKAPKIFTYSLWSVVLFRLVCPISFSSVLSFFTFLKADTMDTIPDDAVYMIQPGLSGEEHTAGSPVNSPLPGAVQAVGIHPLPSTVDIFTILWIAGALALLLYSMVSYIRTKRRVSTALHIHDNIFECDNIESPFVLGIIKPKIYIPAGLNEKEQGYILMHEQTHIRRFDYIMKPIAFLVLSIHWFNPLVWVAFIKMSLDMEMSCDESVLRKMGKSIKKDYSSSILALAVDRKQIILSPLAFGESSTKSRIKNVLNYRQPGFFVVIAALILVVIAVIGLAANPKKDLPSLSIENTYNAAVQQDQLIVRSRDSGASLIFGSAFAKILNPESGKWIETDTPASKDTFPDLTVYISIGSDYKVQLYKSEPELAKIESGRQYRYYKIPKDTYEKVSMLKLISGFYIPEKVMRAIADGKRTNIQSVQDTPVNVDYRIFKVGMQNFYIYKKKGKCYVEQPYQYISEITEEAYDSAIEFFTLPEVYEAKAPSDIKRIVEDNITAIMLSPVQSSNPYDYIKANQESYESILKYGGEDALDYMLSEFRSGNVKDDLHGQIMMILCKEMLGERNNVTDETLSPNEWFSRLSIRQKVDMPDFSYNGSDPVERLVYATEIEKNKSSRGGFTVIASHIFGSYEEGSRLKVFVTTLSKHYILYDKTLSDVGGSVIPAAITYVKNQDGQYTLEKYEQAKDGSEFGDSIRKFCVMPQSGKNISGLADKIFNHYSKHNDIVKLERENLIQHLKANNQYGVSLNEKQYQKPDKLIPLT